MTKRKTTQASPAREAPVQPGPEAAAHQPAGEPSAAAQSPGFDDGCHSCSQPRKIQEEADGTYSVFVMVGDEKTYLARSIVDHEIAYEITQIAEKNQVIRSLMSELHQGSPLDALVMFMREQLGPDENLDFIDRFAEGLDLQDPEEFFGLREDLHSVVVAMGPKRVRSVMRKSMTRWLDAGLCSEHSSAFCLAMLYMVDRSFSE